MTKEMKDNPQKRRQIGSCLGTGEVTMMVIVGRMDSRYELSPSHS